VRRILHWNKLSADVKKVKNVKFFKKKLIVSITAFVYENFDLFIMTL